MRRALKATDTLSTDVLMCFAPAPTATFARAGKPVTIAQVRDQFSIHNANSSIRTCDKIAGELFQPLATKLFQELPFPQQ